MQEHYARTGTFPSEDVLRILGDPRDTVRQVATDVVFAKHAKAEVGSRVVTLPS